MKTHNIHAIYDGKFNTRNGLIVDLNKPKEAMINTLDIAAGLGYTCRFGGQTSHFYSVAQHSVLVSLLAPKELKREALMHDASEAYLGDVIKPLKVMLGNTYKEIEDRFMKVIFDKYCLDLNKMDMVKLYDMLALEMEHHAFQLGNIEGWSDAWSNKFDIQYAVWNPEYAAQRFLIEFERLFIREEITHE